MTENIYANTGRRLTTEEFVKKAISVHGFTYDYSMVKYINANTKVKIICKTHGVFEQFPTNHCSNKSGCSSCGCKVPTNELFISKASSIHDGRYNYDNVVYVNSYTKVSITCSNHGVFYQTPHSHLKGKGCPLCNNPSENQRVAASKRFIHKSISIHGDKYDYGKVVYVDAFTNIEITCNRCKTSFWQRPGSHTAGSGCKKCVIYTMKYQSYVRAMLDKACIPYEEEKRCLVGGKNYRIDFYLPFHNICIEVDEKHHRFQAEYDKNRQDKIQNILNCGFIRIDASNESVLVLQTNNTILTLV